MTTPNASAVPAKPIPVSVLVGFLGAGKTTVLNHILSTNHGRKIAVIVNEFGEVNIDAGLVRHTTANMVEMSNGCICCTLREDLLKELATLSEIPGLEYIIIESTGLGEPLPIAQVFYMDDMRQRVVLDSIVTVVDAVNFWDQYHGEGATEDEDGNEAITPLAPLLLDQVEFTNIILINKADFAGEDRLTALESLFARLNPRARTHRTTRGAIDPDLLIGTGLFQYSDGPIHEKWDAEWNKTGSESEEFGFTSFVYRRAQPLRYQDFVQYIENAWSPDVVRSKGFIKFSDAPPVIFQQAGHSIVVERLTSEEGADDGEATPEDSLVLEDDAASDGVLVEQMDTELVFIGRNMDRSAIEASLDACFELPAQATTT